MIEELEKVRNQLTEVRWSLKASTRELDKLSVLRPGRIIEEERVQLSATDDPCGQARTEDDSQRTPENEISYENEPEVESRVMGTT